MKKIEEKKYLAKVIANAVAKNPRKCLFIRKGATKGEQSGDPAVAAHHDHQSPLREQVRHINQMSF